MILVFTCILLTPEVFIKPYLSLCLSDGRVSRSDACVGDGRQWAGGASDRAGGERGGRRERRRNMDIPVIQRDQSCVRNTH